MDANTNGAVASPLQVNTFTSFPVNKEQTFEITLAGGLKPADLFINISNPLIGSLDKDVNWLPQNAARQASKCLVSFVAPMVGNYNIKVEILKQAQLANQNVVQFQAKAYDLSKVFINGSSGKCRVNESYEFGVDASEAGEGQLEIAVNEGEIPNQVQVLDNGKCIVNFVPEEAVPHVVDIKFNGHNVIGCPFVVQVDAANSDKSINDNPSIGLDANRLQDISGEPSLVKNERILINSVASFCLENIRLEQIDKSDLTVIDPENKPVDYTIVSDDKVAGKFVFKFKPVVVGDYSVELKSGSKLARELTANVLDKFPFPVKVFDYTKVIVSDVTDGVVGHPIYFFIDASQAGSGNLEIRVSSKTRNVPNYPQSEANAKIRVNFTPTEAVDHTIDVKFNGISVPNNPFLVKVSQYPQARLPITIQDTLKYVAVNEEVEFLVDYIGNKPEELTDKSCAVSVIRPDLSSVKLDGIQLIRLQAKSDYCQARFKIKFKATKIGPYKFFIMMNNEILPSCPILSNVYNIHEVKVFFGQSSSSKKTKPTAQLNKPLTFTVDASRAGEGTLALAVVSSLSKNPVPTDVRVSDEGHGLYNLTCVPTEFAVHSIDMSFNDRVVPNSPFVVDILDDNGRSAMNQVKDSEAITSTKVEPVGGARDSKHSHDLAQDMGAMSLKSSNNNKSNKSKVTALSKEDELLQNIVVHGVSLKRTPVSSTGAFIIETNRMAHARDFDVLIADPGNSLVDVQCYLQQDGNLLAEWTPIRVGTHKIEVLYRNKPVPGSPFVTEAFDPSAVVVEALESSLVSLDDQIEIKINRHDAGQADLDVVVTDPNGEDRSIYHGTALVDKSDKLVKEVVKFSPKLIGEYRISVTFGGYEVPKSPLIFKVRGTSRPVRVSGNGLRSAEVNRIAQFDVESSSDGELKLRIECGDREIVPKVERNERTYTIKYKVSEIGYAIVSIYWDGTHIDGSPFNIPVNDLSKFNFIDTSSSKGQSINNQITLDYEPRLAREILLDTSRCGPGELKAEAYCRANSSIKFTIPVNQVATDRHKLIFTCPPGPEQLASNINIDEIPMEATYLIRLYYNNLAVPETLASVSLSPFHYTKRAASTSCAEPRIEPTETNNNVTQKHAKASDQDMIQRKPGRMGEGPIVALRGHGLVESRCGQAAEFTIDGRSVGHGKPEVKFYCQEDEIEVDLEPVEPNLYKATYVPQAEGSYTLNVLWDGKQVAGCPITVEVAPGCDSTKVICTADSLKGGVLGEEIKTFIDTRKAGPGELTALCTGPQKVAFCELLDRGDGTFVLYIKPQESGRHFLTINYGGQHIPKSPFTFKVSGKPDPTKVRVYGPGVEHGVLSLYQSRFVCDTKGAGAGQLTVRIRGPKGAFRMETQRESQRDRTILCKYDPTEPGDYRIEIKWSGRHVPGSPFSVMIFDTQEELNRFLLGRQLANSQSGKKLAGHPAPTLAEYGHYSNNVPAAQQPRFRL